MQPDISLPEHLFLIPEIENSNIAYKLETESLKVVNCVPTQTEELSNSDNDMYPFFLR